MIEVFPEREIFLAVGSFSVRWYGLMYVLALVLAWRLWPHLEKLRGLSLSKDQRTELFAWAAGGVIIGGRLGYALFYEPGYFLSNPLEVFALGHGGMSSHGGIIGAGVALWFFSRVRGIDFWKLADAAVIPAALGLALGRMGNYINQELYGTVTSLPWGIQVPGMEGARHPVQIYAVIKDLFMAGVLYWALREHKKTAAYFLILYGVLRFSVEFFREQEWAVVLGLSRGQLLTVPVILAGVILLLMCNQFSIFNFQFSKKSQFSIIKPDRFSKR